VLGERAGDAFEIPPGRVDELAAELVGHVGPATRIVALGGGRVIDTAKALAAARAPGRRPKVAAIPTTLSAAEMTAVHRRAAGADGSLPGARPVVVINDPALSASQPDAELAASAANALAHAAERGFAYDDPDVAIAWPRDIELIVSERDRHAPLLRENRRRAAVLTP